MVGSSVENMLQSAGKSFILLPGNENSVIDLGVRRGKKTKSDERREGVSQVRLVLRLLHSFFFRASLDDAIKSQRHLY